MSVIIRGMKMPKNCLMCQFHGLGGYKNELIVCSLTGRSEGQLSNVPDCPLVEVPTPHGRIIDGDRTIDKAEMLMKEPSRETVDFMAIGYNHAVADCIAICKGVPTIIEAEEGAEE